MVVAAGSPTVRRCAVKIKTQDLTGAALDWAVAKCVDDGLADFTAAGWRFYPSTNWAQGGPIIERNKITITGEGFPWWECEKGWYAHIGDLYTWGDTPLEAAMRCFVSSRLGDEVDVPEELT